jgi:peptidyl-prolyl cis-trans isomerase SurA
MICYGGVLSAQPNQRQLADFLVGRVGEQIILKSDVEIELAQMFQPGEAIDDEMRCLVLKELMIRKLMVHQAILDSIPLEDEEIDMELDRRVKDLVVRIGGDRNFEIRMGKTPREYKSEMRPFLKEQMLSMRMQQKIMGGVEVSPNEVKAFFEKIPVDSLPEIGKQIEVAQIVLKPKASRTAKDFAKSELNRIRLDIVERGADFALMAKLHSDDPGSKELGGMLGEFGRGVMIPEFEKTVFKLEKNQVSPVIETPFGYHIIQLIERRGEVVVARHILKKPKVSSFEVRAAEQLADSIKKVFDSNPDVFCELVKKFSEDEQTKNMCGSIYDPGTGSPRFPFDYLDPKLKTKLQNLEEGQMSEPIILEDQDQSKVVQLIYIRKMYEPHRANLKDDYPNIQAFALEQKQDEVLDEWVNKHIKNTFFYTNNQYIICNFTYGWNQKQTSP